MSRTHNGVQLMTHAWREEQERKHSFAWRHIAFKQWHHVPSTASHAFGGERTGGQTVLCLPPLNVTAKCPSEAPSLQCSASSKENPPSKRTAIETHACGLYRHVQATPCRHHTRSRLATKHLPLCWSDTHYRFAMRRPVDTPAMSATCMTLRSIQPTSRPGRTTPIQTTRSATAGFATLHQLSNHSYLCRPNQLSHTLCCPTLTLQLKTARGTASQEQSACTL